VNSARYAIYDLDIQFRYHILCPMQISVLNDIEGKAEEEYGTLINAGVANVPHRGTLNHVPHRKSLDRLVLRDDTRAVGTTQEIDVATAFLVSSAISSFLGLRYASSVNLEWSHAIHLRGLDNGLDGGWCDMEDGKR
jgi:hypothetical protein